MREIFRQLPNESVVYFGDTARLPYGNKSKETVTRFSVEIADDEAERRTGEPKEGGTDALFGCLGVYRPAEGVVAGPG